MALTRRPEIYGSTFFIATSFHGLNVIIGSTFLIVYIHSGTDSWGQPPEIIQNHKDQHKDLRNIEEELKVKL
jgi:heme/copper-type cytochrome/quinol oxidase subunit 3